MILSLEMEKGNGQPYAMVGMVVTIDNYYHDIENHQGYDYLRSKITLLAIIETLASLS